MAKRTKTVAKKIVKHVLGKKAEDVLLFDLRKVTTMTDFFIICTGGSGVHVKAIADAVIEGAKKDKTGVYHVEGYDAQTWILIDLVDIVVHVFQRDVRNYYQLERLWGDAEIEAFNDENEVQK